MGIKINEASALLKAKKKTRIIVKRILGVEAFIF